jgi:hypothetical protein
LYGNSGEFLKKKREAMHPTEDKREKLYQLHTRRGCAAIDAP